ncbi:MAG: DUF4105 domain-containing protein [Chitinophagaceae bacterium]|nr:DUF4105 domain-containing protein [Chitinophagaceae bacterium]
MKIFRVFLLLLFSLNSFAQTDSCNLEISLLTCGPGQELYSLFGHSAIRVKEKSTNRDIVFNYGTFDFDDPDFYTKFTRGKLLYFVSTSSFNDFIYEYQYEGRSVIEQVLNLSCEEKEKLLTALRTNAKEENKYYHYDFVFDNCSTRLRDILEKNNTTFNDFLQGEHPSFRDMIHEYLDKGNQPWSKFGIDLVLGSRLDKKASDYQAMFLPDYLMNGFDKATINNKKLVASTNTLLPYRADFTASGGGKADSSTENSSSGVNTPLIFTMLLCIIISILSFFKSNNALKILDFIYFFILGALGFFLLFMWFGTDHQLCANNYNLLWALPTHLPVSFFILSKKTWVKKYFTVVNVFYLILILSWNWLPQGMNFAFFPLALTAGIRSFCISTKK